MNNHALLILALIFVSGCGIGSDNLRSKESQISGTDVLALSPEVSTVIFHQKDDPIHVCMSPGAMAVQTRSSSLGIGAVLGGNSDNLKEGNSTGAQMSGGISPNVHIARELMYRTCEFSSNFDLSKPEAIDLYMNAMKTIAQLPDYGRGSATTDDNQSGDSQSEDSQSEDSQSEDSQSEDSQSEDSQSEDYGLF